MANFGFIIDNRRCIGCHACTVACKSEHEVPIGVNRTWVKYIEKGVFPTSRRLFSVMRCNHCDAAPCVEICPVTALFRRQDGIVDFDNRRCIGCKACMQACPYDALYIDPDKHTAAKCNYCAHRIDKGLQPACVIVCPTQAIISGDLDDPTSEISRLKSRETVHARKVEKGTEPALFYIDADQSSLDATATDVMEASLWGNQTGGVGHYARFMDQRLETENGNEQLLGDDSSHPLDKLKSMLDLGDSNTTVLVPDQSDPVQQRKASDVQTEVARRVYDTPSKGTLWGWQVTAYVWTKAIASGVGVVASLAAITEIATVSNVMLWITMLVGLGFLGLTGYLLTADLDQPKRFLYVMLRPQWKSWLVRGAYIISAYALLLALWPVAVLIGQGSFAEVILWLMLPIAGMTAIYTAFLFAQAKGRDFWQSPLLCVHMFVHACIAGAAFFAILLPASVHESWVLYVMTTLGVSIVIKLVIDWFELAVTHATKDAKAASRMIWHGRYRVPYWLGVVLTGCLIPLALTFTGNVWLMPLAGVLSLIGLYFAEHVWLRAPQQIPLS